MADKSEKKKETTNKSAKKTLTKKSEKLTPAKDTAPKQEIYIKESNSYI